MDHENPHASEYQNAMQEAMDRRDNGGANGRPTDAGARGGTAAAPEPH
ncbi:MAG TPA: hypothetical protein VK053_23335 [Jiangellaceae bacterium]|nr:hypothetical protein [Jiangellaceae bacterium]